MSIKEIGSGVNSVTTGSAVKMLTGPFIEGRDVEAIVDCDAFNGTVKIQSSEDDGDTWVDELTVTEAGSDRTVRATITLKRDMRYNMTARTAGEVDINLRAGD